MRHRIDSETRFIFAVINALANGNRAAERHE
jgi:hypothetical protein